MEQRTQHLMRAVKARELRGCGRAAAPMMSTSDDANLDFVPSLKHLLNTETRWLSKSVNSL